MAVDEDLSSQFTAYRRKRDMVVEALADDFELARPEGAFYAFPRAPRGSGTEFVAEAIKNNVLIIPGNVFSMNDTHFRISYAVDDGTLARGLEVLRKVATCRAERLRDLGSFQFVTRYPPIGKMADVTGGSGHVNRRTRYPTASRGTTTDGAGVSSPMGGDAGAQVCGADRRGGLHAFAANQRPRARLNSGLTRGLEHTSPIRRAVMGAVSRRG